MGHQNRRGREQRHRAGEGRAFRFLQAGRRPVGHRPVSLLHGRPLGGCGAEREKLLYHRVRPQNAGRPVCPDASGKGGNSIIPGPAENGFTGHTAGSRPRHPAANQARRHLPHLQAAAPQRCGSPGPGKSPAKAEGSHLTGPGAAVAIKRPDRSGKTGTGNL